ncbi:hypothetical protein OHA70_16035 [Kribbella sp. NBC_00382]|uniref:hypothetical protein n=1 Tax=Kribbella sp. NBC_00382 TaxID=2975967 RepID=UPI002E1AEDC1
MDGLVDIKATEAFNHFDDSMKSLVEGFDGAMGRVASTAPAAAPQGGTDESKVFMTQERQARDTLAQYLTQTSQGFHGYQTAVASISDKYGHLLAVTTARMNALLKPSDHAVPTNPVFTLWDVPPAGGH